MTMWTVDPNEAFIMTEVGCMACISHLYKQGYDCRIAYVGGMLTVKVLTRENNTRFITREKAEEILFGV